ncbi:MAG: MarR family transcriptional regulator [Chloroflexi bacterium OHK40]
MDTSDYLDSPVYWLRRAFLAMHRAIQEELSRHDITGAQFEVLRQLWSEDGLEQRVIQERLGVSSPTLTGVIDSLVERRLVERCLSPEDARVRLLLLTDAGRATEAAFVEAMQRVQLRLVHGFSPSEQALLKDWLRRVAANMGVGGEGCND